MSVGERKGETMSTLIEVDPEGAIRVEVDGGHASYFENAKPEGGLVEGHDAVRLQWSDGSWSCVCHAHLRESPCTPGCEVWEAYRAAAGGPRR
jgi:hypothetical protein